MSTGNIREQLINGFQKAQLGLDKERIKNWVSSELENENRGALAAIVFYSAIIRECMIRKIDDPIQVHWIARAVLSSIEGNEYGDVFNYMVGGSLPEYVSKIIENYKENLLAATSDAINMINNLELNVTLNGERLGEDFDDEFSEEFDLDFDEEEDNN